MSFFEKQSKVQVHFFSSAPPSPDGEATNQMSIEEKDDPKSQQDKNIERAQEIRSFRQQALQLSRQQQVFLRL